MAIFYNQATITSNSGTASSNVVTGEIREEVTITKTPLTEDYQIGRPITYVVNIVNSGNTPLVNMTVTDNLGETLYGTRTIYPLNFVDGSLQYFINGGVQLAPAYTVSGNLTIQGISVPAGGNTTLLYEATPNSYANPTALSTITNTATLSGAGLLNDVEADSTITASSTTNLSISKSVCPDSVSENGQLTYTFVIQNTGNLAASASEQAFISDTFDPILNPISVTFDGVSWAPTTNYTYDSDTGVFQTVPGQITVPAANYVQDTTTGEWTMTPGVSVLRVSGTI